MGIKLFEGSGKLKKLLSAKKHGSEFITLVSALTSSVFRKDVKKLRFTTSEDDLDFCEFIWDKLIQSEYSPIMVDEVGQIIYKKVGIFKIAAMYDNGLISVFFRKKDYEHISDWYCSQ